MTDLFLCPAFSSPELSAQATLPAGYSPLRNVCFSAGRLPVNKNLPDTDSNEKTIGSKCRKHTAETAVVAIRSSAQGGKQDKDAR